MSFQKARTQEMLVQDRTHTHTKHQCYTNQDSYKSPENLQEKNIAKNQEVNLQSRLLKVPMVTRPMPAF